MDHALCPCTQALGQDANNGLFCKEPAFFVARWHANAANMLLRSPEVRMLHSTGEAQGGGPGAAAFAYMYPEESGEAGCPVGVSQQLFYIHSQAMVKAMCMTCNAATGWCSGGWHICACVHAHNYQLARRGMGAGRQGTMWTLPSPVMGWQ